MNILLFLVALTLPNVASAKTDYLCSVSNGDSSSKSQMSVTTADDFDELDLPPDDSPAILEIKLLGAKPNSENSTSPEEQIFGGSYLGGIKIDRMACGSLGSPRNYYDSWNKNFTLSDDCHLPLSPTNPYRRVSLSMTLNFKTGGKISISVSGDHPFQREILLSNCQ